MPPGSDHKVIGQAKRMVPGPRMKAFEGVCPDSVDHNPSAGRKPLGCDIEDRLELPPVPADEHGTYPAVRPGMFVKLLLQHVTHHHPDSRSPEPPGIALEDPFALGALFKCADLQPGKLQPGLDGYRSGAEADIPEVRTVHQVES